MVITQETKDYQRDRRIELATEITDLITAYTEETGLEVNNIRINVRHLISGEAVYGLVDVEVRL